MLFWVEKGLAKLTIYKHVRPLLRRINSAPVISSQKTSGAFSLLI
ncbi:hypothetical protein NC652_034790 [Populus alba x Populus x berolinensis]|nr:hypothetical protein NC652_034790 [Populus alba x Populus x berolinensis]